MKIRIRAAGFSGAEGLRAHVRRRIDLVLSRFAEGIRAVDVHIPGPSPDGYDPNRRCRLDLLLALDRQICVEDLDVNPVIAVNRAFARAAKGISRIIELDRPGRRGPA